MCRTSLLVISDGRGAVGGGAGVHVFGSRRGHGRQRSEIERIAWEVGMRRRPGSRIDSGFKLQGRRRARSGISALCRVRSGWELGMDGLLKWKRRGVPTHLTRERWNAAEEPQGCSSWSRLGLGSSWPATPHPLSKTSKRPARGTNA